MKNLLLVLATLAILALATELVARLVFEPVSRENFTIVPQELRQSPRHSGIPYSLREHAEVRHEFGSDPRGYFDEGASLTYRTNNIGFRGPDIDVRKPPATLRIVGLGDSFTFGTGVRYEDTFLARLQKHLDESADTPKAEVINLGVPGYKTSNEVATLLASIYKLKPDVAVICFFLNDNGDIPALVARFEPGERPWYRMSRFVDTMIWRVERRREASRLVEAYYESFQEGSPGWQLTKVELAGAKNYSKQHGFELAVMIFPVLWQLSGDYPFAAIHDKVCHYVDSLGVPCLDLLPAFEGYDGPELWVHPNNQHPNEVAHAVAANALYEFLVREGVLERALETSQ